MSEVSGGTLAALLCAASCLIDGAASVGDDGMPCFDRLRYRRDNRRVVLFAFDLLELDGNDLRREPLDTRKATLASLIKRATPGLRLNKHIEADGPTVFAHACKLGLEGIVSKRKGSPYVSGHSPYWVKSADSEASRTRFRSIADNVPMIADSGG